MGSVKELRFYFKYDIDLEEGNDVISYTFKSL